LRTGRTHQIRVHLQHHGYPIVGDDKYGLNELDKLVHAERLMLHAYKLTINHPITREKLSISAPIPEGFESENRVEK
jgi:23S rRNA pseudouridine955/2504/2580 synthase